ncbi:MAG TPA: M28 family peptidase [Spirochaetota bacterium]|nr:M28 family peptidase [Spirochaetota bacterium]
MVITKNEASMRILPQLSNASREKNQVLRNARDILHYLSVELGERTIRKYQNLEQARDYIKDYFSRYGYKPREETYTAAGVKVSNVIAEIPGTEFPGSIILVGAHYDTIEDTPGADDNTSGIAALLEIYRLLAVRRYRKTVRFVAFTLEEPPFFSTELMGSMVNAVNCRKRKDSIELMVCLEMVGFASRRCPQDYPLNHKHKEYPVCGNYISVISLPSNADSVYRWKKIYNNHARCKIFEYIGPASIPGMDLSDHMSFIRSGYPAIMISDTGFYRNKNYHSPDDTIDTINFKFMADVIVDSTAALRDVLDGEPGKPSA